MVLFNFLIIFMLIEGKITVMSKFSITVISCTGIESIADFQIVYLFIYVNCIRELSLVRFCPFQSTEKS